MKYNNEDVLTAATCFIFLLDTQNARGHHTLRMYTKCWLRKQREKTTMKNRTRQLRIPM